MNYRKNYVRLMKRARDRICPNTYLESHHVFPVSIFGKNNFIVKLTAREHYIAHLLLWKDFQKRYGDKSPNTFKMAKAVALMSGQVHGSSRLYSIARTNLSKAMKGNQNTKGRRATDEERKEISERNKGNKYGLGRIVSRETKEKQSASMKGRRKSDETRAKISAAKKGKSVGVGRTLSQETKDKIAASLRGRKSSKKGQKMSEDFRKKISDATKGRLSPRKGAKLSDETKRKISNTRRSNGKRSGKGTKYSKGKWVAEISIEGKNKYLGRFNTEAEARSAWEEAAAQDRELARSETSENSGP